MIAAGSLLEFALADKNFSMPVGRVEYLHMGPMTFEEFLLAEGEPLLLKNIQEVNVKNFRDFSGALHQRCNEKLREFLFAGGMPEVVFYYTKNHNLVQTVEVQRSIINTYKDDFSKYASRRDLLRMQLAFDYLSGNPGRKIK